MARMPCWGSLLSGLKTVSRKKRVPATLEGSSRHRHLSTVDLVALGLGSMLGAGIYIMTGQVAKSISGPSIVLSFLIAALVSALAGLCYAEFGSRVPLARSDYLYSYVTMGELWAFISGWNLVLSYAIGTSSVAKVWSANFDQLLNGQIWRIFGAETSMSFVGLAEYLEVFAAVLVILLTGILCLGVKESTTVNKVLTAVNLLVLLFVIVSGFIKGDLSNWQLREDELPQAAAHETGNQSVADVTSAFGVGGFMPYGFTGTLAGASICFYAFIGFSDITTTGADVRDPQRSFPLSIILSLLICFLMYFGVSAALTLMMPYYLVEAMSPLPLAFQYVGWINAQCAVATGSLCALTSSLLASLFRIPWILYSMAQDGLFFKPLAKVNSRQCPVVALLVSGGMAALLALLFDLKVMVDIMCIAMLMTYSLVAVCVLLLRYRPPSTQDTGAGQDQDVQIWWHRVVWPPMHPTSESFAVVAWAVAAVAALAVAVSCVSIAGLPCLQAGGAWCVAALALPLLGIVVAALLIWRQPQSQERASFMVPCLPFLPLLSITINCVLMAWLRAGAWMWYLIWMAIGFLIYFGYGIRHSTENHQPEGAEPQEL
ncbi:cationic amino acid transporter 2-like [Tyto alba]|uniref:cationic amino acid transporter 2-like n=1 Tax=Tyto alba TaxID=56313 RepID=UPI001C682AF1|nr:cationic amino acid transporter 2-like [Tyto alba]